MIHTKYVILECSAPPGAAPVLQPRVVQPVGGGWPLEEAAGDKQETAGPKPIWTFPHYGVGLHAVQCTRNTQTTAMRSNIAR
jgi:hypothetical protein